MDKDQWNRLTDEQRLVLLRRYEGMSPAVRATRLEMEWDDLPYWLQRDLRNDFTLGS